MKHGSAVDLLDTHATGEPAPGFVQRAIRFPWTFILFFVGNPGRLVRFCLTGGVAALVQLLVLRLLTADHWEALLSNGIGMAVAAQVNFTLSSAFTWRDRWVRTGLHRRWSIYQLTILVSAIVNMLIFIVARLFVEQMIAAMLGIAAAAALNFAAGDRIIFRLKQAVAALEHEQGGEAIVPVYVDDRSNDDYLAQRRRERGD